MARSQTRTRREARDRYAERINTLSFFVVFTMLRWLLNWLCPAAVCSVCGNRTRCNHQTCYLPHCQRGYCYDCSVEAMSTGRHSYGERYGSFYASICRDHLAEGPRQVRGLGVARARPVRDCEGPRQVRGLVML